MLSKRLTKCMIGLRLSVVYKRWYPGLVNKSPINRSLKISTKSLVRSIRSEKRFTKTALTLKAVDQLPIKTSLSPISHSQRNSSNSQIISDYIINTT